MAGEDIESREEKNRGVKNYSSSYVNSQWTSWLIPMFVVANVAMFVVVMYINNCPKHVLSAGGGKCVGRFLGRFSLQPLRENPLFGPSSSTAVGLNLISSFISFCCCINYVLFLECFTIMLIVYSASRTFRISSTMKLLRIVVGTYKLNFALLLSPYTSTSFWTKLLSFVIYILEKLGALEWTKVVHKDQGWRLVTCIWLHAGIIHLATNMLSLVFIGIRLEQQFGFVRIGIIYLLSGFGGSILSALFIQRNISVGASGALFGLLGAMLSELITNWTIYTNKAAAIITLLFIVIVNLAVGILPHVNNYAHIGGFLAGLLLGFVFLPRPQFGWVQSHDLPAGVRLKSKYKAYQYVLWLVSLILLVAGLSVGVVMVFGGANGNEHCHWCHYLSLYPPPTRKCDDDDGT